MLFCKAAEVNQGRKEEACARLPQGIREDPGGKDWTGCGLVGAGVSLVYKVAKITKTAESSIRVLLTDSSFQSYYHPSVTLRQNDQEHTYTVDSPELQKDIVALDGGRDGIEVLSISRAKNPPVYYGTLKIRKTDKGLLLINELPLETYLEGVVPSEMPSSYEEQALMAQAVCARTYAICQMKEKNLEQEYGADVDDSVNYQVYGNFGADEKTNKAVERTKGQIMCQNGEPITAYYFSTSAGWTSTDEIWGKAGASSYLKSVECDFDQNMPWSSWEVEIPWQLLEERIKSRQGAGTFTGLQIVKKSVSGAVTEMEAATDKAIISLQGEYEIREFLSPEGLSITEKDGSVAKGGSLLPSAYFDLEIKSGQTVKILGRGYGHGVGMSQNGANEMAKNGYTWQEILAYFFKDITLEKLE